MFENISCIIIGTLNVYVTDSSTRSWIWTLSGNQGQQWVQGQVPIPQQTSAYKVRKHVLVDGSCYNSSDECFGRLTCQNLNKIIVSL